MEGGERRFYQSTWGIVPRLAASYQVRWEVLVLLPSLLHSERLQSSFILDDYLPSSRSTDSTTSSPQARLKRAPQ